MLTTCLNYWYPVFYKSCNVMTRFYINYFSLWNHFMAPNILRRKRIKLCEAIKEFHTRTIFNCMNFLWKSGKIIHKYFHIKQSLQYTPIWWYTIWVLYFYLNLLRIKKTHHIHIEQKEIHRARYSQNYLSRRRKCYEVYLFIGNFKSLCCNKHVFKCIMESISK